MATPPNKYILVVAIDIGTTYSGYAFSFTSEFYKDPRKISCNQWLAGGSYLISPKTPTALLLRWNADLHDFTAEAFGYEAENKFISNKTETEKEDFYLARRFKMDLYQQTAATGLSRDMKLDLGRGKSISTMTAFSMYIGLLKEHFEDAMKERGIKIQPEDIHWVLTVPAIWTDGAKQFMRESAIMAGIDTKHLSVALEPEAASLYCLHLSAFNSEDDQETRFSVGTKYMVVDCGGGTIDVCVHEIVDHRTLVEKHVASGGNWGGTMVDDNFLQIWVDIVGRDVFQQFKENHEEDLAELCKDFEFKKRTLKIGDQKLMMRFPQALKELYKKMKDTELEDALSKSEYAGKVSFRHDKVKIDLTIIRNCFKKPVDKVVDHLKTILANEACKDATTILLVGGFAESCFLKEAISDNFSAMKIVVPEDPSLAVMKGAVLYGHDPTMIQSRFAKYTYGVRAIGGLSLFSLLGIDIGDRPTPPGLSLLLPDMFDIHVKKGQYLKTGEPQKTQTYHPLHAEQTKVNIELFVSTEEKPRRVTDESCSRIGSIALDISDTTHGLDRPITVTFTFGGTEIEVRAVEEKSGKEAKVNLNLLD